jgi:hypothetical protein
MINETPVVQGFLASSADDKKRWGMVGDEVVVGGERFELPTLSV